LKILFNASFWFCVKEIGLPSSGDHGEKNSI
jgi:hypothetical protein